MDEHCAHVAHQLDALAERAEQIAHQLSAQSTVTWVSLAANRYRDELTDAAAQIRLTALQAREASGAVWRHAVAVGAVVESGLGTTGLGPMGFGSGGLR